MGNTGPPPEGSTLTNPEEERLRNRLAAWQAAGVIDAGTAARIEAFEAGRPATDRPAGISVSEVIAYIGAIVLLVGVGFLYGTQYAALGSAGRLVIIGLVVAAGLAAGELVERVGATGAARRARAAGWTVAAVAAAIWFSQAFVDANVLTQASRYGYHDAPDTSGSIMLAAAIGSAIAAKRLWRSGPALLAVRTAPLGYTTPGDLRNSAPALPRAPPG